ncbi:hypothetical protein [uncultured Tenacibaculum sp.]|uniref:hypothetical protein n=1 Tax=uncultured Tenacibaculum sp. TaxID=174713 RepID=UPI00262703BC|nr:hypothetical protein [uncultured Tenacibaculum sp.]
MKNQISSLGKALSKNDQKNIKGGFFGCQPQLLQCDSHRDCPPCSSGCGITVDNNGTPLFISGICAF